MKIVCPFKYIFKEKISCSFMKHGDCLVIFPENTDEGIDNVGAWCTYMIKLGLRVFGESEMKGV